MTYYNNATLKLTRKLTQDEVKVIEQNYDDVLEVFPDDQTLNIANVEGELRTMLNLLVDDLALWGVEPVYGAYNTVSGDWNGIEWFNGEEFVGMDIDEVIEKAVLASKNYALITVVDREIETKFYSTRKDAQSEMLAELKDAIGKDGIAEIFGGKEVKSIEDFGGVNYDCFEIREDSAWANDTYFVNHADADWKIVEIARTGADFTDEMLECTSEACAYNNRGICRFSKVKDRAPIITEENGCEEGVFDGTC